MVRQSINQLALLSFMSLCLLSTFYPLLPVDLTY